MFPNSQLKQRVCGNLLINQNGISCYETFNGHINVILPATMNLGMFLEQLFSLYKIGAEKYEMIELIIEKLDDIRFKGEELKN